MIKKYASLCMYIFYKMLRKIRIFFFSINFKRFGKNNIIYFPIRIYGKNNITIGDNCSINAFVHIWGTGGIEIGNNVMIAAHVTITSLTHDYNSLSMRFSPVIKNKVTINDEVWIGSGAIILPGITIGKGAVIGAGSVVTHNVPDLAVVAGNPARIINSRNIN